jgi:hypothetical protein
VEAQWRRTCKTLWLQAERRVMQLAEDAEQQLRRDAAAKTSHLTLCMHFRLAGGCKCKAAHGATKVMAGFATRLRAWM